MAVRTNRRFIAILISIALLLITGSEVCYGRRPRCQARDLSAASAAGQRCNRPCVCNGNQCSCRRANKQCRCDGVCGVSCIDTEELCPELELNEDVEANPADTPRGFRSIIHFSCRDGYELTGFTTTSCRGDKTWSNPVPTCTSEEASSLERVDCGEPTVPPNGRVLPGLTGVGDTRTIVCDDNFYPRNNENKITCQANGRWSALPSCQVFRCDPPPEMQNAIKNSGSRLLGSSRRYLCNPGFTMVGTSVIQCQNDGTWNNAPICTEVVGCDEPDFPPNGIVLPGFSDVGDNRTITCNENYMIIDEANEITCQENGRWSALPLCEVFSCDPPPNVQNANVNPGQRLLGSSRKYTCSTGYIIIGTNTIQCQENGVWTNAPACVERSIDCPDPPTISNAQFTEYIGDNGDVAVYRCNTGYARRGSGRLKCEGPDWVPYFEGENFECVAKTCGSPTNVFNARKNGNIYSFKSNVTYECNAGYQMEGINYRTCKANQQWSLPVPRCIRIHCNNPVAPVNGMITRNGTQYGSVQRVTCREGFVLRGSSSIECQANGSWTRMPQCNSGCQIPNAGLPEETIYNNYFTDEPMQIDHITEGGLVRVSCPEGYRRSSVGALCHQGILKDTNRQPLNFNCIADGPADGCVFPSNSLPREITYRPHHLQEPVESGHVNENMWVLLMCPYRLSMWAMCQGGVFTRNNSPVEFRCT